MCVSDILRLIMLLLFNCVGSVSYATAVDEQKLFFPGGLCCKETEDLKLDAVSHQTDQSQLVRLTCTVGLGLTPVDLVLKSPWMGVDNLQCEVSK